MCRHEVTVAMLGIIGIEPAQELLPATFLVDVLVERFLFKLLVGRVGQPELSGRYQPVCSSFNRFAKQLLRF
jgi:hypothetical protein